MVLADLFTRGIDIQAVNVVINFDFPKNSRDLISTGCVLVGLPPWHGCCAAACMPCRG